MNPIEQCEFPAPNDGRCLLHVRELGHPLYAGKETLSTALTADSMRTWQKLPDQSPDELIRTGLAGSRDRSVPVQIRACFAMFCRPRGFL